MGIEKEQKPLQVVGIGGNPILAEVWRIAEPLCLSEGLTLVHIEFQREQGGRILRLFLDKPGGIMLEDCAAFSRQLSDLLDVGLETDLAYNLEVSSPGLQRPLGRIGDFVLYKGHKAKIRTIKPIEGQKNFTGILEGLDGDNILLKGQNREFVIAFSDISKAHLVPEELAPGIGE